jgi:SpoVK/Ycf46/Vps4 family AAA+-type ATPase
MKAIMSTESDIPKNTTNHKLNLGTLLSKLDGIGNYNGLIVVGTTNYIEKLDPALYRELRLTPIKFDKLRKEDCIKIIKSYFNFDYDEKLNDILVDRKITPTKLIHLCHQYENINIDTFFNEILVKIFV